MLRKMLTAAAMVTIVVLLAVAGVVNYRARKAEAEDAKKNPFAGQQNAVLGTEPDGIDVHGTSLKGKPAPDFTLKGTDGKPVKLSSLKGHPVVVNFWATWCAPCKLEMPWFQEQYAKHKDAGLVILGLAQDDDKKADEIASKAKSIGVSYPILLPDESVARAYGGVDYLPQTFYVDRNGIVVEQTSGAPTKDEIDAFITKVMQ